MRNHSGCSAFKGSLVRIVFTALFFWAYFTVSYADATEAAQEVLSLREVIQMALEVNLDLKVAMEETQAAVYTQKAAKTAFFPAFSTSYRYRYRDQEERSDVFGLIEPQDLYSLVANVTQPVFTGFSVLNSYKIASLGFDIAKASEVVARRNIIFAAEEAYFSLLKAEKLVQVSQEAVVLLEAHRKVAENFYRVGMTPLNDLLKAEVELANARQELISARNTMQIAKSNFNTLLRRPINADVCLKDLLDYVPFDKDIDFCIQSGEKNRLEIEIAGKEVELAEKELALEKKDLYPSIYLEGNYYRAGTDWDVDGGETITDDSWWTVTANLTWNFWEWGKTSYGAKEKLKRVYQAQYEREKVKDSIRLEVKEAYLNTLESEKNIAAVEKAVQQARENYRISEERYKEQMATSTDVLDARTLLSKTITNYYRALYDLKLAQAALSRAMGQEVMEQ